MHEKQTAPVCGPVKELLSDLDAPECRLEEVTPERIVIPRDINDARSLARLPQDFLYDIVVCLGPEPVAAELPTIDDVSEQIQVIRLGAPQKVQQRTRLSRHETQCYSHGCKARLQ